MSTAEVHPVEEVYELPLSYQQERLALQHDLDTGARAAYHVPVAVRIDGEVDDAALQVALQELVDRHEVLRTTVSAARGVQEIRAQGTITLLRRRVREDVHGGGDPLATEVLADLLADLLGTPFDLGRDLPLRTCLVSCGATAHVLVLVVHHIACDAWSLGLLSDQLFSAYADLVAGRPVVREEDTAPLQYADFADWQRRTITGQRLEDGLSWWEHQLAGAPPFLDLPLDRPRTGPNRHARSAVLPSSPRRAAVVDVVCDRYRVSGFTAVLTAFAWVLGVHARQSDVVVGVPSLGRDRPELHDVVGCFFDVLAVRPQLGQDPTVEQALAQARLTARTALAWAEVPFHLVVDRIAPPHHPWRTPVFQALVNFQDRPPTLPEVPGLRLSPVALDHGGAKYDVALEVHRLPEGMRVRLDVDSELLGPVSAARMLDHLDQVLRHLAEADPGDRLGDALLPTEEESEMVSTLLARELAEETAGGRLEVHDEQGFRVPAGVVGELVRVVEDGSAGATGLLVRVGQQHAERVGSVATGVTLGGCRLDLADVREALGAGAAVEVDVVDEVLVVHVHDGRPTAAVEEALLPLVAAPELVRVEHDGTVDGAIAPERPASLPEVLECFSDVLGRPVGAEDHFFRRGGTSLAATRLVERLERVTGVAVGLRDLIRTPTPSAVAEVVERVRGTSSQVDPRAWDPTVVALVSSGGPVADELCGQLRSSGVEVVDVAPGASGVPEPGVGVHAVYAGPALYDGTTDRAAALETALRLARAGAARPLHHLGLLGETDDVARARAFPMTGAAGAALEETRLVSAAADGVPVVLYRLPEVTDVDPHRRAAVLGQVLRHRCDDDADGRVLQVDETSPSAARASASSGGQEGDDTSSSPTTRGERS